MSSSQDRRGLLLGSAASDGESADGEVRRV